MLFSVFSLAALFASAAFAAPADGAFNAPSSPFISELGSLGQQPSAFESLGQQATPFSNIVSPTGSTNVGGRPIESGSIGCGGVGSEIGSACSQAPPVGAVQPQPQSAPVTIPVAIIGVPRQERPPVSAAPSDSSCPASSISEYAASMREYEDVLSKQLRLIRSLSSSLMPQQSYGSWLSGSATPDVSSILTQLQSLGGRIDTCGNTLFNPTCMSTFSQSNAIYMQALQALQRLAVMQRQAVSACMTAAKERAALARMTQVMQVFTYHAREALQAVACMTQSIHGKQVAEQLGGRLTSAGLGSCSMISPSIALPFAMASEFGVSRFGAGIGGGCGAGVMNGFGSACGV